MKHLEGFLTGVCEGETDYVRRGNEIVGSCCWPTRHHLGSVFLDCFFLSCLSLSLSGIICLTGSVFQTDSTIQLSTLQSVYSGTFTTHVKECLTDVEPGEAFQVVMT